MAFEVVSRPVVRAIRELLYWRQQRTNFTTQLYDLMCHADRQNLFKLRKGFPNEWKAYTMWRDSEDQKEYFDYYLGPQASSGLF